LGHNYKLKLEYNGSRFFGSQIQDDLRTIQGELNKALNQFMGINGSWFKNASVIETSFSSRTDAGVHAIGQVVNFKTDHIITEIANNPDKILIALNSQLPEDMALTKIEEVPLEFHARFNAKSREYLYKIFVRKHRPILRLDSLMWQKEPLDYERMAKQAKSYIGTHDFSPYAQTTDEAANDSICNVIESELIKESEICYKYRIKANRYLRHMVRRIVGELIQVGKGQDPSEDTRKHSVPAAGLTLVRVEYECLGDWVSGIY
jgi:tRNA pseudouridine38-40 synthase